MEDNKETTSQYDLHGEPKLNIVKKDEFQKRVSKVFAELGDILSKSFGAYGAPTFISNQAHSTVTKDGYTIMKNLVCDTTKGSPVDKVIYNMADDVCGRLNYKVGDGTTTAIIATNAIYDAFVNGPAKESFEKGNFLPRDIMFRMKVVQEQLVERISNKACPIRGEEDMLEKIRNVVNISSNGDKYITDMITKIYEEIGAPFITCELSSDNRTYMDIVNGYQLRAALTDKIYVNSDDNVADLHDVDVLVFDHKVTKLTYEKIIKPLNNLCRRMERKLVVIAPIYDQTTMYSEIKRDLMDEFNKTRDINLVLLVFTAMTSSMKKNIGDLAVLLNTEVIDSNYEAILLKKLEESQPHEVLDISGRGIKGIYIAVKNEESTNPNELIMIQDDGNTEYNTCVKEGAFRVGFIDHMKAGFEKTVFSGFHYNEAMYEKILNEAQDDMEETIEKYSKLATFSYDVVHAQQRYNALRLKMAYIEVGGDSSLSQLMLKDSVDDSIRAAESAFQYGYILGCNVTTLREIRKMYIEIITKSDEEVNETDYIDSVILSTLYSGFCNVYEKVLNNAFPNKKIIFTMNEIFEVYKTPDIDIDGWASVELTKRVKECIKNQNLNMDEEVVKRLCTSLFDIQDIYDKFKDNKEVNTDKLSVTIDLSKTLISYSVETNQVFDLSTKMFTSDIINSAQTDMEVLTAVIDLMSILFNGNQLVITAKSNFQNS